MDRLSEMEAFVAVVDQGGFTDGARKLGISKSAISKHISGLESRLGVRLLNRTTRRVSATELGLSYYDKAIQVLRDVSDADDMVAEMQEAPRGSLRVSAPVSFGLTHMSNAVADFLQEYPEVSVNMSLEDRFVDLVSEGYDVAIRIGTLEDSSLRARKLSSASGALVASEDYLAKHGTPETIEDLSNHHLLHYSNLSTGNVWRLINKNGEERQVRAVGRLTVNNGTSLLKAAEAGLGITQSPSFIARAALRDGKVVEVLPDLPKPELGIYAVYPPGLYTPPKLRAFIDFLVQRYKTVEPCCW